MTKKRDKRFEQQMNDLHHFFTKGCSVTTKGFNQDPEFEGSFAFTYDFILHAELDFPSEEEEAHFWTDPIKAA